jgi:hypothetical protein
VGKTSFAASLYAWSPNKWQIQRVELLPSGTIVLLALMGSLWGPSGGSSISKCAPLLLSLIFYSKSDAGKNHQSI